ncbi:MAG TPA: mandelate racemase/muconate lactonizing enzyme family protein [Bryobacteraceae bacterium]|jgi:L-alanine-DL-glutamate epimerase-like enolase superfamily enzyme|nr:mandelate racemase/muconate lactonizing enzyme family protein [Bryobacteraceae bacterium]
MEPYRIPKPLCPSRRQILKTIGSLCCTAPLIASTASKTAVRVKSVSIGYQDFTYRVPIKFGGRTLDRVTLLNVDLIVEGADGRTAKGTGSMPLGNVWSWPAHTMTYDQTLQAMKDLAARVGRLYESSSITGHPIDITWAVEPEYLKAAADLSTHLAEPIPKLCTIVTASPFDAALHDAYGRYHNRNAYQLLTPEYLPHDLSHYLGRGFEGEHLASYILPETVEKLPLYHLVGALDPITEADIKQRVNDGLPETLPEWIRYNGLRRIKIKLNGNDLSWDIDRVAAVHKATAQTQAQLGVNSWYYSLDFNEKCKDVNYVLQFIANLRQRAPEAFPRIQYIEQPTARDLVDTPAFDMHQASRLIPLVIDESLTGIDAMLMAEKLGYSGAALKACKGISQSLINAALGQKHKLFLCIQDLTCPGASLIESVGLAAHVPGIAAIEANARQYVPAANRGWDKKYPGVFVIKDGYIHCSALNGAGLGFV